MNRTSLGAIALGLGAILALSACSGTSPAKPAAAATDGTGKTITVWVMQDDLTDATINAINDAFTKKTGASVNVELQQWDSINTKMTTSLASSNSPDVVDLGNTDVPLFAASGGLLDLTDQREDLEQGQTWLAGLVKPAEVDGHLYAVPSFGSARAVIYNKKIWAAAGVTTVPTTYPELTAALDKVKAANPSPDFSAFYLPGQNWYAGVPFVWDANGQIAEQKDSTWSGAFETADSVKGLEEFKKFQNTYSSVASQTLFTKTPSQNQVFADGQASAQLGSQSFVKQALTLNPALTADDIGTFPFPGVSGKNQPAVILGSDWGVAAHSSNPDLATEWVKIAASPEIQEKFIFGTDGWIPNSEEGIKKAEASGLSEDAKAFFTAALRSDSTPASGGWATIEGDSSMQQFFQSVATGSSSVKDAAKAFDEHLTTALNKN